MYTRIISTHYLHGKLDEALQVYRESILPALSQQPGFEGVIALMSHPTDAALSITLWETKDDLQAGATSGHLQTQLAKVAPYLASAPVVETFEAAIWEVKQGTAAQYARVITFQLQPEVIDDFVLAARTRVLPEVKQQPGVSGVIVLANAAQNRAMSVTLWERQADLEASEASGTLQRQMDKGVAYFAAPPTFAIYEVGAQA